jgi:hypothetical protein
MPRQKDSDKPYNDSKIRYKLLIDDDNPSLFYSPDYYTEWEIGKWNTAKVSPDHFPFSCDIGFHVFVTLEDAINFRRLTELRLNIVELEVDEFNSSGTFPGLNRVTWEAADYNCETWKRARVVELISAAA